MQAKYPGWRAALLFVVLFVGVGSGSAFGTVDKHASPTLSPLPYPKALQPRLSSGPRFLGPTLNTRSLSTTRSIWIKCMPSSIFGRS